MKHTLNFNLESVGEGEQLPTLSLQLSDEQIELMRQCFGYQHVCHGVASCYASSSLAPANR